MEAKKVIVENFPITNQLWSLYFPLVVSLLSLIIAIISLRVTRNDIIASHRPFVRMIQPINIDISTNDFFRIRCLNAPARVLVKVEYYGIEANGNEILLYSEVDDYEAVVFPSGSDNEFTVHNTNYKLNDGREYDKIRRRIIIQYKELSSDRKYFFATNTLFKIETGRVHLTPGKEEAS